MSVINISRQRAEELVDFLNFEKQLFVDSLGYIEDQEDFDTTVANFDDTIEVIKSVLNALD